MIDVLEKVLALASLRPNHLTLSGGILDQLASSTDAPQPQTTETPATSQSTGEGMQKFQTVPTLTLIMF